MSSDDWTIKPLGELITLQRGYDLPKSEFVFGEYPIAGSNGIIGYHNQFSTEGPSITIGRSGNLGTPYFYEGNFWAHNTTLFIKEFKNSDPKFMYYLFQILDFSTLNSGSAVPSLNRNYIHPIRVLVPKRIETQRRIAEILSALDEKIELNRQTNATLEAIAQAIFEEWFVDFNYPGATGEMVDSELGPIPNGWSVGKLSEIFSVQIGGDWGKDSRSPGAIQAISLRGTDIDSLKFSGAAPKAPVRWIKESSLEKRRLANTDVLIGGSGLGPIGKSIYCDEHLHELFEFPITYSNFCKRLSAPSPAKAVFGEVILENLYKSGEMRQYFTGTSIPNLDINSLLDHKLIIPSKEILDEYFELISKCKFHHLFNNENEILSKLRDSLLPKLMSGEIQL